MSTQLRPRLTWLTAQYSSAGARHIERGEPCQDFSAMRVCDGVLIFAAADGVSSASAAELGSRCVCKIAVSYLAKQRLRRQSSKELKATLARSLLVARKFLEKVALTKNLFLHDLATTCIVAVATPMRTVALQIGDGGCVACTASGKLLALTTPVRGEAANYPDSITDSDFKRNMRFASYEAPVEGLALFTDGVDALALESFTVPHRPFFEPLFGWAKDGTAEELQEKLRSFLESERLRARTADDCTLVIARRWREFDA